MKFVKLEDVEKILGDIYESMGSSRHNWYEPLRKNDVEEWWWSDDKNNDFVEHAHWEEYYGDDKCTSCGFVCGDSFYLGSASFCPNCGAKMDEVHDGNLQRS